MIMAKISLYLFLSVVLIVSAIADSEYDDLRKKLSSKSPAERIAALRDLKQTDERIIHQQIISIALLDTDLEVRVVAENILNNFIPMDTVLNRIELAAYKTKIQKLRVGLSSVVLHEQVRALKSLKDMRSAHPLIQYTLIKEIVFRSVDESFYTELIRIAAFDSYFQKWLGRISTGNVFSSSARSTAKNILMQIKPSLEFQQKLLFTAISDSTSNADRNEAKKLLIKIKLDLEIQKELSRTTLSDTISSVVRNTVRNILEQNKYIHLDVEQHLVDVVISDKSSSIAREIAREILHMRNLHVAVQKKLLNVLIVSDKVSDTTRTIVQSILMWNDFISLEVERSLASVAIADKVSITVRTIARQILYIRNIRLEIQEGLLNVSMSNKFSNAVQIAAKNILMRIRLNLEFQQRLLNMSESPISTKLEKKVARDILVNNRLIHPNVKENMGFFLSCRRAFRRLHL